MSLKKIKGKLNKGEGKSKGGRKNAWGLIFWSEGELLGKGLMQGHGFRERGKKGFWRTPLV